MRLPTDAELRVSARDGLVEVVQCFHTLPASEGHVVPYLAELACAILQSLGGLLSEW